MNCVYALAGTLIFSGLLVLDPQIIMKKQHNKYTVCGSAGSCESHYQRCAPPAR